MTTAVGGSAEAYVSNLGVSGSAADLRAEHSEAAALSFFHRRSQ